MRINIKTNGIVKDKDVKAVYLLDYALSKLSTKRMLKANLDFVLGKYGFKVTKEPSWPPHKSMKSWKKK